MVSSRYRAWFDNLVRQGAPKNFQLDLGSVYAFAYSPDEKESIPLQHLMPVFVITHANRNKIHGINIQGIRDRRARLTVLKRFNEIQKSGNAAQKLRAVYDLRRLVERSSIFSGAQISYKWKNIQSNIAEINAVQLEELINRIL